MSPVICQGKRKDPVVCSCKLALGYIRVKDSCYLSFCACDNLVYFTNSQNPRKVAH